MTETSLSTRYRRRPHVGNIADKREVKRSSHRTRLRCKQSSNCCEGTGNLLSYCAAHSAAADLIIQVFQFVALLKVTSHYGPARRRFDVAQYAGRT